MQHNNQVIDSDRTNEMELQQVSQVQNTSQLLEIKQVKPHRPIEYRADIDGLRAVAITLVVIYHAFPTAIPGGFIGVDVFFVISGFLISAIIIKETEKQKFTYLNFYIRRIKRIYPALILVLAFTLYMIKKISENFQQVKFYLGTLDAALIFGANIQILTHEKGYFDADVHSNPLLHLWSLGVEEQFYIIWPFMLTLVLRFFRKRTLLIMSLYTILSFTFSIVAVSKNVNFAFYFPICRFWQMSIGGILAYINVKVQNKKLNEALSGVGLIALLIAAWSINGDSLFPGFWALFPTLGAACIIQARNQSSINKYILSSKPFVFIGKISYSLYLWHWPLLVYSRTFYPHGSTSLFANTYFILFLTVALTILTYYTFENPVRKSKKKKWAIVLIFMMIGIAIGSFTIKQKIITADSQMDLSEQQFLKLMKSIDQQMVPGPEDYVTKNGITYPNFSFNKNRQYPNFLKIKSPQVAMRYDTKHGGTLLLEKLVDGNSIYNQIDRPDIHMYQVANQGRQNKLFLIGDSHARSIAYRFQKLYETSKEKGELDSFPTVLATISLAHSLNEENTILNVTRSLVDKFKPQRLLFACGWQGYVCKDFCGELTWQADCDMQKADRIIKSFVAFALQMRARGVEVTTLGVDIDYWQYHPGNLVDANGVIDKNIKPFKYSAFRKRYQKLVDKFETLVKEANITMIDIADNLCWEDQCHIVSPKGYSAYLDCEHLGAFYSRNWLTTLDHLVQF